MFGNERRNGKCYKRGYEDSAQPLRRKEVTAWSMHQRRNAVYDVFVTVLIGWFVDQECPPW